MCHGSFNLLPITRASAYPSAPLAIVAAITQFSRSHVGHIPLQNPQESVGVSVELSSRGLGDINFFRKALKMHVHVNALTSRGVVGGSFVIIVL